MLGKKPRIDKFFVIKLGNFVEVRTSKTTPRALVSRFIIPRKNGTKLERKQIFYEGGEVLGVCRYDMFHYVTGINMEQDKMIRVGRSTVQLLERVFQ
jgi:hypothetical protein